MNITKLSIVGLLAMTSCASIIKGSSDRVEVNTEPKSTSATCELKNGRSTWNVPVPGSTQVKKSKTDLEVNCKDNATGATGKKIVESDMEGWFLGNIVLGGIIGGIVDASTGSMWQYPKDVTVNMVNNQPLLGQPAATPVTPQMTAPVNNSPQPAVSNPAPVSMQPVMPAISAETAAGYVPPVKRDFPASR